MKEERPLWDDPRLVWCALAILWTVGMVRRLWFDFVPGDFTAYMSAADMFAEGQNPYTDARFSAPRYDGFPYNYFPGTLFLILPMAFVSTRVLVGVEWVIRAACLVFCGFVLQRRISPDIRPHHVALLMLAHEPLVIDTLVGNMVVYLLAAWAVCLEVSSRTHVRGGGVWVLIAGVVTSFKPFWLIPTGWIFVARRQWVNLAWLVCGVMTTPILSLFLMDFWPAFRAHTQHMREFYFSVDLLSLAPTLLWIAVPAAVALGLWVWRKYPSQWVFLLGCVSVPIWPRVATYSYVITLPFSLFLIQRFGLRGLAFSVVTMGPLPWLLRDAGILPGEQLENWVMYVWCSLAAVLCIVLLKSEAEKDSNVAVDSNVAI